MSSTSMLKITNEYTDVVAFLLAGFFEETWSFTGKEM